MYHQCIEIGTIKMKTLHEVTQTIIEGTAETGVVMKASVNPGCCSIATFRKEMANNSKKISFVDLTDQYLLNCLNNGGLPTDASVYIFENSKHVDEGIMTSIYEVFANNQGKNAHLIDIKYPRI